MKDQNWVGAGASKREEKEDYLEKPSQVIKQELRKLTKAFPSVVWKVSIWSHIKNANKPFTF